MYIKFIILRDAHVTFCNFSLHFNNTKKNLWFFNPLEYHLSFRRLSDPVQFAGCQSSSRIKLKVCIVLMIVKCWIHFRDGQHLNLVLQICSKYKQSPSDYFQGQVFFPINLSKQKIQSKLKNEWSFKKMQLSHEWIELIMKTIGKMMSRKML